jgi:hypothetical protein
MSIALVTKGMIAGFGTGGTGSGETIIVEGLDIKIDELGRIDLDIEIANSELDVDVEIQDEYEIIAEVE